VSDSLDITYDLSALPTAQHRAGLAGMLVQINTMRQRRLSPVPDIRELGRGRVHMTVDRPALTALFNDLYDSTTEEVSQATRRKSRDGSVIEPLREEKVTSVDRRTGKERTETRYVYPQVVPRAPALQALDMPLPWLKLWRDLVWQTLRGIPKTRLPYEQRAGGGTVEEATRMWADLQRGARQESYVTEVASSLYIGAQAFSAERVPFTGRPADNLLLHFWPVVMWPGEAWRVEMGDSGVDERPAGYVIAVPDVIDLGAFVEEYPAMVAGLNRDLFRYRPRDAVLALPAEGALQFLRHLAKLLQSKSARGDLASSVAGVQTYHLEKRGNSIAMLGSESVVASPSLVWRYEAIQQSAYDLLFRAQLVRNLLDERDWYAGFDGLFESVDSRLVLGRGARRFTSDVRRRFTAQLQQPV
jgi:CRISPR-associated protein Cmx8